MWYIAGMKIVPRNYALVVNSFFWTILALIFIIIRLFTRGCIVKKIGLDDWLMAAAMVSCLRSQITFISRLGLRTCRNSKRNNFSCNLFHSPRLSILFRAVFTTNFIDPRVGLKACEIKKRYFKGIRSS
jgi:hypothetical protein